MRASKPPDDPDCRPGSDSEGLYPIRLLILSWRDAGEHQRAGPRPGWGTATYPRVRVAKRTLIIPLACLPLACESEFEPFSLRTNIFPLPSSLQRNSQL